MPIQECTEGDKRGVRWGESGKCYFYEPGNEASRNNARHKCYLQAVAIGGGKLAKEDLDEIPDELLKEVANETQDFLTAIETAMMEKEGVFIEKADKTPEYLNAFHNHIVGHRYVPDEVKHEAHTHARAVAGGKLRPREPEVEVVEPPVTDINIIKSDETQQKIWGQVLRPSPYADLQGDVIDPSEIEKAAHTFLEKSPRVGLRHKGDAPATIIESYTAPIDFNLNGQSIKKGTWVLGVHVKSTELWKEIKEGRLNAFSIGGRGNRHALE